MWNLTREEQIIIFMLLGAFLIGFGIQMRGGIPRSLAPPPPREIIRVRMSGAIRNPGWYTLPKGTPLEEAVHYAGGPLPWANLHEMDPNVLLNANDEIHIPAGKLNINGATAEELAELPGIGPVLAARIVNYRKSAGAFQTLSQILEVKGIGKVRLETIREMISLGEIPANSASVP